MNCSYRIIDKVHIGERVRKTSDKSTLPFDNKPMKDVKIESYDKMGFIISHPSMPKKAFLDFKQLPLTEVTIEKGFIKTEITFVESILRNNGVVGLQLIRTDTFDYLELLDDRKDKDEREKFTLSDIIVGDKVTSCICRDGNPMYYLGTFSTFFGKQKYNYHRSVAQYTTTIEKHSKRAWFAYVKEDGKINIVQYSLTHKNVIELYKNDSDNVTFKDVQINLNNILDKLNFMHGRHNVYTNSDYDIGYVCELINDNQVLKNTTFRNMMITYIKENFKLDVDLHI